MEQPINIVTKNIVRNPSLETIKAALFTDIVNEFGIKTEDLDMFSRIVYAINAPVHVDRLPISEDLEIVDLNEPSVPHSAMDVMHEVYEKIAYKNED